MNAIIIGACNHFGPLLLVFALAFAAIRMAAEYFDYKTVLEYSMVTMWSLSFLGHSFSVSVDLVWRLDAIRVLKRFYSRFRSIMREGTVRMPANPPLISKLLYSFRNLRGRKAIYVAVLFFLLSSSDLIVMYRSCAAWRWVKGYPWSGVALHLLATIGYILFITLQGLYMLAIAVDPILTLSQYQQYHQVSISLWNLVCVNMIMITYEGFWIYSATLSNNEDHLKALFLTEFPYNVILLFNLIALIGTFNSLRALQDFNFSSENDTNQWQRWQREDFGTEPALTHRPKPLPPGPTHKPVILTRVLNWSSFFCLLFMMCFQIFNYFGLKVLSLPLLAIVNVFMTASVVIRWVIFWSFVAKHNYITFLYSSKLTSPVAVWCCVGVVVYVWTTMLTFLPLDWHSTWLKDTSNVWLVILAVHSFVQPLFMTYEGLAVMLGDYSLTSLDKQRIQPVLGELRFSSIVLFLTSILSATSYPGWLYDLHVLYRLGGCVYFGSIYYSYSTFELRNFQFPIQEMNPPCENHEQTIIADYKRSYRSSILGREAYFACLSTTRRGVFKPNGSSEGSQNVEAISKYYITEAYDLSHWLLRIFLFVEGVAAVKILFVGVSPFLTLLSTCIAIPTFLLLFLQSVNVFQRCQLKRPWNIDWNSSIHPFVLNFVVASISVLTSLGSLAYWVVHMQGDNVVVDRFVQVSGLFEGLYICLQGVVLYIMATEGTMNLQSPSNLSLQPAFLSAMSYWTQLYMIHLMFRSVDVWMLKGIFVWFTWILSPLLLIFPTLVVS